ncbi:MocR-like pyridoxine biosynthesis transcription factor PdxR [Agromyces mangrovi Wang et al. 2018]|uniref:MocR-like pyridoxine biosynthesis transcription factor PdxR n=1 Tax=Agromyces mangrovi TaxID=1858653 RepID=UPI00257231C7|nr:PLP-dependent aminotransferase family protein [Agromyces mangrovi]
MDGPILAIAADDARPVGRQLVDGLRAGILGGGLRAGDPLPSTRRLADELGVSRSTVVAAYEQLAGEGYLETRQGAATRVADLGAHRTSGAARPREREARDRAPAGRGARATPPAPRVAPLPASEPRVEVDLRPGRPSTARIDARAWRSAWRAAAAAPIPSDPPPATGEPALRAELADHLRVARGISCDADDIVVTAGTSEALALLATALCRVRTETGPRVAVEDPGYPDGAAVLRAHGAQTVPVSADDDGLDLAALAAAGPVDAVMVTPSHQYPLGGRLPVGDRLALLDQAARDDAIVLEDDYDSEYRHTGAPLPTLTSLDADGRTVLVGSLSKVLTPWLRVGYLVLPPAGARSAAARALRAAVLAVRSAEDGPVAGPVQLAVAHLLASGALRRHIAATRREYAHRRGLVLAALDDLPGARLHGLDGGLHAVLELHSEASARRLVTDLAADGVVVAPLADYAASAPPRRHGIVVGYAGVTDTALAHALARIRARAGRAARAARAARA